MVRTNIVMSEIQVNCRFGELVPVDDLNPNPKNPNLHTEEQVGRLADLIKYHGWRSPVVVSKQSGMIVSGHGRYAAAHILEDSRVPVDYQEFKSEADEMAHLVADNYVAELSAFDATKLKSMLAELEENTDLENTGLQLSGFNETDLQGVYMDQFGAEPTEWEKRRGLKRGEADKNVDLICPSCGFEWTIEKGNPHVMIREGSASRDVSPIQ
jgi:hypothetical protein